jgi:hypothetical protein
MKRALTDRDRKLRQLNPGAFDEDGVLRDGARVRVPVFLMDGADAWRQDMHQHFAAQDAAQPTFDVAAHRPGFRDSRSVEQLDALEKIYQQHDAEESERWRNPPSVHDAGVALRVSPGARATSVLRAGGRGEGSPGHLRFVNGKLLCVPDNPRQDSKPTRDAVQREYELYDLEASQQYRNAR